MMEIIPLASDSLGVRSMATFVQTQDVTITIDPSAALGPKRYRLPPTQKELNTLKRVKKIIHTYALKSDILTISHYHYDHFDPNETFYTDKNVFAKNIKDHINKSQQKRGSDFQKQIQDICELTYADESGHSFGSTSLSFSPPFFHGPENVRLGYVIMTTIKDDSKTVVHASDVQGPVTKEAAEYIIKQKPDLLIMDGPPTLFLGWRFSTQNVTDAAENLIGIITQTNCEVLLDHHLLRDLNYKKRFSDPYEKYDENIYTFAEYLGKENNTLEAHRKSIWEKEK
ncbi:MAG TPA: MBL fold metallo-hydrolase [Candidatus Thermoplasmatota archaeon]|nr:MBL fold metallo-hydrolase [Candidatus Thermoplasmatota archaeon]